MELIIGSRGSKLALWQANWVREQLEALDLEAEVRVEVIKTTGDVKTDVPLSTIGGQGAFTKELEQALLDKRIDIAVHSLKDLPTVLPEGLTISAITEREDARDALVLREGDSARVASLKDLRAGAIIGTSSQRRVAQLKNLRPDVVLKDVRGNVDTRLRKLDAGWYDALILASAGLRRLGLEQRISAPITVEEMLPAVGQGALGIETRDDGGAAARLVARLDHRPTRAACVAERALLRRLGGGCQVPIAAHGTLGDGVLRLEGLVAALDGSRVIRDSLEADAEGDTLGEALAERLLERGAAALLAEG
ncbi:MAG TPA: hydroxymethylbilane synthase [Pyrinomonadaceae bacterium]|nr:hydroxymethylbilane synthase [Pyrinomonadaceae bacterium]